MRHFTVREKGRLPSGHRRLQVNLVHPCAMADLPKAGLPWKLPPPLVEGQELHYRFYDDANLDREVFVIAAIHDGVLQWVHLESKERPRRMVGTNWPKKKT